MSSTGKGGTVNVLRWNAKVNKLLRESGPEVKKIVDYGNNKLGGNIASNLSGGSYMPGRLPVTRVTGTLFRAYQQKMVTPYLYMHGMDSRVSNYAKYVHFGTKHMAPRPYFENAVQYAKMPIMHFWRATFLNSVRKTGRA